MKIPPAIFKAYDVRGLVPGEINAEVAYAVGRAFAEFARKKYGAPNPRIVLSRDVRLSSPEISGEILRALIDGGASVIDAGITTTPMHYWITGVENADGGIMVTASHNPKQYNGFKLTGRGVEPLADDLATIRAMAETAGFAETPGGKAEKKNYISSYAEFVTKGFTFEKNLGIAIDASNGAVGLVINKIFQHFPKIFIRPLYFDPDGSFPNHDPNPLKEDALHAVSGAVVADKMNLGVIFDADGDRVFFIDEKGERIRGDIITALLASRILKDAPGLTMVYNASSSRVVRETIEAAKGIAVPSRTGHTFVKKVMREKNAVFGGEYSGHYYFRETYYAESAELAMLRVMDIVSKEGKPFSEMVRPFQKYFSSGEINFPFREIETVENAVKKEFAGGVLDTTDGLTIEFPDWRINLRHSNTEPLIRLNVEANTEEKVKSAVAKLSTIIKTS